MLRLISVDNNVSCAYNVRMNQINTTLTTSGNSVAVRLSKEMLRISGLGNNVTLEARQGKIIISKATNPRENWESQIQKLISDIGDPTTEFKNMDVASQDGLEDLAWDGPTFENWQKNNAKLS
jgi:antitoxin component of MazEF toxin-antitoxin module